MNKKEILDAFWFRHACKEFDKEKKISADDFNYILETARLSPSSFGFEPWHFIVVQRKEMRDKLKNGAWGAELKLDTASHFVVALSMKSVRTKYDSPYLAKFMKEVQQLPQEVVEMKSNIYENFQKKDFNLNDDASLFTWATKQTYIALGNMLTAAALIGIDSCPIEGFNPEATNKILKEEMGVDTDVYGIAYMAAFGYRKQEPHDKTRRSLEEITTWL